MTNRLQTELARLYGFGAVEPTDCGKQLSANGLSAGQANTRCMVLGVAHSAAWDAVHALWQHVQSELGLPRPAIAVDGADGFQLWFALAEGVSRSIALEFLHRLASACLASLQSARVQCLVPGIAVSEVAGECLQAVPCKHPVSGHWSAFIAPDLGRIFESEPWLVREPGADAQADVLSHLTVMPLAAFQSAMEALVRHSVPQDLHSSGSPVAAPTRGTAVWPADDPHAFLLAVMNDPTVDLHARIKAAKALLPAFSRP
jgi:hypothetical protein